VYSILLYTGYNFESKKMVVANRVSICGNIQEYEGNIQISGLRDTASKNPDNIQFIEKDYEIKTTSITAEELINATSLMERMFVKLENVKVTSLWTTKEGSSAGAITITGQVDDKTVTIRTTILRVDYELVTEDYFEGKTITVMGFIETYNEAKQIKLVSVDDVAFVE
ncbi:MAG: hypothetical protein K2F56_00520, partial [Anaeroplasmataceae bacterium]|nr:hypothetical protein [Anaeroplasmataceae bacterium]